MKKGTIAPLQSASLVYAAEQTIMPNTSRGGDTKSADMTGQKLSRSQFGVTYRYADLLHKGGSLRAWQLLGRGEAQV